LAVVLLSTGDVSANSTPHHHHHHRLTLSLSLSLSLSLFLSLSLSLSLSSPPPIQIEELLEFVAEARLDNVGVFMYSAEEDSASFKYPNHVSEDVKQDRFNRLMAVQEQVVLSRSEEWVMDAKLLEVVIDGTHPEDQTLLFARHKGQVVWCRV
jgi:hypothetical protein